MRQMHHIKTSPDMGRGLYATTEIQPDRLIFTAELLVLSEADTETLQSTDLSQYTFVFDATRDCLVLGDGELFNHSDTANVRFAVVPYGDRHVMAFYSTAPIEAGQQLFINYNQDVPVQIEAYTTNLVG